MIDDIQVDPNDFAKYATIENILNDKIYHNKKVRVLGTIIHNDKQSKKICIAHNDSKIECMIPDEYADAPEENHTCQIIGVVVPTIPSPIIRAIFVKPLNSVNQEAYDFAVQKYNEFVFQ